MSKHTLLLFTCIVVVAIFLRFWQVGTTVSLEEDEVAWGYNAYSIGIDGKDEFGRFLPFDYLESFGDFKPPLYAYADVLPVKVFGLNSFAVRFPSAFFGVLTVVITYFLVKRIFTNSTKKEWYSLMSSFVLAISPWHIMLSRAAFEANVATFFLVLGVWLFLIAVEEKKWYFIFSAISFVLAMYTFNTSRVVAPLLVAALAIGFHKRLLILKKEVILAGVVGLLLLSPTISFLFSPNASLRFKEVNIFSNLDIVKVSNEQIVQDNNSIIAKLFYNRRLGYAHEYLKHYFDNLSPQFLFLEGDPNPRFSIQSVGQMYLWDILFFFLGMLYLFKQKEKYGWILPVWILLGIIPAATARETPHALRIETTLPAFQIFVAYGFVNFIDGIKKKMYGINVQHIVGGIAFVLLFLNVFYFVYTYFNQYPKRFSAQWQYGYKEAISYAVLHEKEYTHIYIPQELGRPYIHYVFYAQYDPRNLRTNAKITRDLFGFVNVKQIGAYEFPDALPSLQKGNLYITYFKNDKEYSEKVPKNAQILQTIHRLDGSLGLTVYTL
jgi:hypothetical protein